MFLFSSNKVVFYYLKIVILTCYIINLEAFSFTLGDPYPENAAVISPNHPLKLIFDTVGIEAQDYEYYLTYFVIFPLLVVAIGFMSVPVGFAIMFLYSWKLLLPGIGEDEE